MDKYSTAPFANIRRYWLKIKVKAKVKVKVKIN